MKQVLIILLSVLLLTGCGENPDVYSESDIDSIKEDYLQENALVYVSDNYDPFDVYEYDYLLKRVTEYDPEAAVDYIFKNYDLGDYMNEHYYPETIFPGIEDRYYEEFIDMYHEDLED